MKIQQFQGLQFRLQQHTPILFPPFGTPLIADPTVLLPTETPDRKWHLFAHTFWGIQQFTSADGVQWQYLEQKPLLAPDAQLPWMGSHIYACDPKIYDGKLYLYFNARNHAHWSKGSEKIGLAIAEF
ncbi:MAG: hypothetical protein RL222_811 [Bacteroidota bacterium]|jgi:hypothetical protein